MLLTDTNILEEYAASNFRVKVSSGRCNQVTWINKGAHGDSSPSELWEGNRRQNPVQAQCRQEHMVVAPLETIHRVSQQAGITVVSLKRTFCFVDLFGDSSHPTQPGHN